MGKETGVEAKYTADIGRRGRPRQRLWAGAVVAALYLTFISVVPITKQAYHQPI